LGTARINKDNTLEILDEPVAKGAATLPKTGNENSEMLYYLGGMLMILLSIKLRKKRK
jgi:Gram positive anchor.